MKMTTVNFTIKIKKVFHSLQTRRHSNATSEVFMTMSIQVVVFWDVIPYSDAIGYQCFRGPCCIYLHPKDVASKVFQNTAE
jgi:hypothetical protein